MYVSSNVDVTTKYCRKKDSQYYVTAPFFATIYHDNRNHLGCCNAFWIAGKVMLLVPYFRKIANISIVLPQSCPIESYRDSIVEKCFLWNKQCSTWQGLYPSSSECTKNQVAKSCLVPIWNIIKKFITYLLFRSIMFSINHNLA